MTHDPLVEEIHRIRKKMWDECGGDYDKLVARWMAAQAKHKDRVVLKSMRSEKKPVASK